MQQVSAAVTSFQLQPRKNQKFLLWISDFSGIRNSQQDKLQQVLVPHTNFT